MSSPMILIREDNSYQENDSYQEDNSYQKVDNYQEDADEFSAPATETEETLPEAVSQTQAIEEDEPYSEEIIEDVEIISVEPMSPTEEDGLSEIERNNFSTNDYAAPAAEENYTPPVAEDYTAPAAEENYTPPVSNAFQFTETQTETGLRAKDFEVSELNSKPAEIVEKPLAPAEISAFFEKSNGSATAQQTTEPVVGARVDPPSARSRFGDRNVDLPIEVSEDERRLHNDARRFARLLVSEIKLYNEQKVKEGREAQDLYNRLREAIDRSREMYNKRVQPPVAAKFDYFHYELVNTLAEGETTKLGGGYPGSTI